MHIMMMNSLTGTGMELLKSMPDLGVGTIVDVSATYESCEKVLALAGKYPHVYAAIGVHPDEVGELNEDKIQHMKELCCNKKSGCSRRDRSGLLLG